MAFKYDPTQLQPLSAFAQPNYAGLNNIGAAAQPLSFGSQNSYNGFAFNPQLDMVNSPAVFSNYVANPANAFGLSNIGNTQPVFNGLSPFTGASSLSGSMPNWADGLEGTSTIGSDGSGLFGAMKDSIGSPDKGWWSTQLQNTSLADMTKAGAGLASSLYGIYAGSQQNKMAKQQMAMLNDQWQTQWNAQRKLANNQMSDAYEARVQGGGATSRANSESTEDYMKRKGV